MWRTVVS